MHIQPILFYIFSLMLISAALMVIIARNPVHSVLFLVLAFFAAAALWLMLEAEFLALVLILVYVGAVMTLFLFVVMILNVDLASKQADYVKYLPVGLMIIAFVVAGMLYVIGPQHYGLASQAAPLPMPATYSNVTELGSVLYTQYVYPFELSAVLLLVAIIAAICLSLRNPRSKKQNISAQLRVRREERVSLLKIKSEPRLPTSE